MKLKEIIAKIDLYDLNEEYEIFIEEYLINEGLIKTWPIDKSVSILKSSKYQCDIDKQKENCFNLQLFKEQSLDRMLVQTNNLGWFPSYYWFMVGDTYLDKGKYVKEDIEENREKYESIIFRFEAKYDIRVENIPKYLFHVTPRQKAMKILTLGLVPKSNSMTSSHPPRIFISKNDESLEKMIRNNPNAWEKSIDGKWIILRINTALIPNYFKIFKDPNAGKDAYFTLNNIPAKALEIIKTFEIET